MVHALEAGAQRLRRPIPCRRDLLNQTATNTRWDCNYNGVTVHLQCRLGSAERKTVTDVIDMVDSTAVVEPSPASRLSNEELAAELLARADGDPVKLVGPGGLLSDLTRRVLEASLEAEMTEHVGYEPYDRAGYHSGNSRNGTRSKTVITDIGPVAIEVPRDRAGTFEPVMVPKRKRRLGGVDQMVLSLSAKGLTHGEISAHLEEIYGAKVSKETVTRITDSVIETMAEWQNRPLDAGRFQLVVANVSV